jgi:feruloyl esterase
MLPTLRYHSLTPPDPTLDPLTLNVEQAWQRVAQTAALNDADWTFLNTFAQHGKLILYQGISDYGLSAKELAAWYDRLAADTGGHTQDWARLFLVPGMAHCSGGRATDQFDPLQAVQDWVEHGRAPERMVARGASFPGQSRPLCPWPQVARYAQGDPKQAGSFECR